MQDPEFRARMKSSIGDFKCDGCNKVYKWKKSLNRHKRLECGKDKIIYKCKYCEFTTTQILMLNDHMSYFKHS